MLLKSLFALQQDQFLALYFHYVIHPASPVHGFMTSLQCVMLLITLQALPEMLLPFLRLAHCPDAGALRRGDAFAADALDAPRDPAVEGAALGQLIAHLRSRLARFAACYWLDTHAEVSGRLRVVAGHDKRRTGGGGALG